MYVFILNYICMHMLRHYESLKKCVKNAYVYLHIYMSFHDKVKNLNGFIKVF